MTEPTFEIISIDRVVSTMENNSRSVLGDIQDLTESIKAVGVMEPILVKNLENDKDQVEVFAGYKRLAASKLAKKDNIPVIIHSRESITPEIALTLNLAENVQRENLNPMDEAKALRKLRVVHEMSDEDICARVGIRKSRLDQRFRLLEFPDDLQNAVSDDHVSMAAAFEIAKLPDKKHKKYIKLATELKGEHLKRMVKKELDKIAARAEKGDSNGTEKDDAAKEESAAFTELSRSNRKHTHILASYIKLDDAKQDEIKSVNWRAMELDDLKVVTSLFDSLVDSLPNQLEFNVKAEAELVEIVEKGEATLDKDSPIVRQALIEAVKNRSQELAMEGVPKGGKRPKVSYAMVKKALDEFYGTGE